MDLLYYERELNKKGYTLICGVDEAGRGPLAGPVAVGAAVMDLSCVVDGVNDSKKLSPKKRDLLYEQIIDNAICWNVVCVDEQKIDEINILAATKEAMRRAVSELFPVPDFVLVDAVKENFVAESLSIIKGDAKSYSIAAASILAKVTRDRIMEAYAKQYPEYGFEQHKGYGTAFHIEMLKKYGPCPIHRKSFIKNFF